MVTRIDGLPKKPGGHNSWNIAKIILKSEDIRQKTEEWLFINAVLILIKITSSQYPQKVFIVFCHTASYLSCC